jgi:hypothetical protein
VTVRNPSEAVIEPRTVAILALTARRSNHSARSHPLSARSHPHSAHLIHHSATSHRLEYYPIPPEVFGGRAGAVPDDDDLVEVGEGVEAGEGADEHGLPLVGEHHHRELLLRTVPAQRGAKLLP